MKIGHYFCNINNNNSAGIIIYKYVIVEIILTFKKANLVDLNETPQNSGTSFDRRPSSA